ncbi:MAG: hypothetical protein JKY96_05005 [Phycisphaerales bacterium]|nr:hypothetical protein [Phycisphaerales bacterium]
MPNPIPDLHALFVTHTHHRIARSLLAMQSQHLSPASITVGCDSDDPRIQPEIQRVADTLNREIHLVLRPRNEAASRSQNRNNAVRALIERGVENSANLVFYDGDCIACPISNEAHSKALQTGGLSLGWAVMLSEDQTLSLTDDQVLQGNTGSVLEPAQHRACSVAHRQCRKRIFLKKLRLTKPHKPGILSGNFAISLSTFRNINGFDESFTGWGMEDDDLARRAYLKNTRPVSSMNESIVFHQYHATERPKRWSDSPNAHRLLEPALARCEFGLDHPAPQSNPITTIVAPKHLVGA